MGQACMGPSASHLTFRKDCLSHSNRKSDIPAERTSGVAFHGLDLDDVIIHETLPAGVRGVCQLRGSMLSS